MEQTTNKPKNYRVPSNKEFIEDQRINDMVYSYLLENSSPDMKKQLRYIKKRGLEKKLCDHFNLGRTAIRNALENLIKAKAIAIDRSHVHEYYVIQEPQREFQLIPSETMSEMVNVLKTPKLLKIYIYLYKKFQYKINKNLKSAAQFTITEIMLALGYDMNSTKNMRIRTEIIKSVELLINNGLLEIELVYRYNEKTGNKYPVLEIINMSKEIKQVEEIRTLESYRKKKGDYVYEIVESEDGQIINFSDDGK